VIIGVAFAARLVGHGPASGSVAGVPRYYLTLDGPWSGHFARAVVRSSATGAALASVRIPLLDGESPSVTGAADGRTFLIVDNTRQAAGHGYGVRFYRLRVGPDGHALQLRRLSVNVWPLAVDDVALSPDGSRLAIAGQSCRGNRCQYSQIQVRSLATGATKTWRTRAPGAPWILSWAAGGHQVGFLWESGLHSPPPTQRDGYRLLNVAGPGNSLLTAGAVVPTSPTPRGGVPPALLTPDGRAFITSSTRIVPSRDHQVMVIAKIIKLSARNGRVQRVLYATSARGFPQKYGNSGTLDEQGCTVLSLDPTGHHPLVRCFLLGRFSFGTLASGHLRPLPGIPNIYCVRECRGPMWGTAGW